MNHLGKWLSKFIENKIGYILGIGCGFIFDFMMPNHSILALLTSVSVAVFIALFWTGIVSIKFEKR